VKVDEQSPDEIAPDDRYDGEQDSDLGERTPGERHPVKRKDEYVSKHGDGKSNGYVDASL